MLRGNFSASASVLNQNADLLPMPSQMVKGAVSDKQTDFFAVLEKESSRAGTPDLASESFVRMSEDGETFEHPTQQDTTEIRDPENLGTPDDKVWGKESSTLEDDVSALRRQGSPDHVNAEEDLNFLVPIEVQMAPLRSTEQSGYAQASAKPRQIPAIIDSLENSSQTRHVRAFTSKDSFDSGSLTAPSPSMQANEQVLSQRPRGIDLALDVIEVISKDNHARDQSKDKPAQNISANEQISTLPARNIDPTVNRSDLTQPSHFSIRKAENGNPEVLFGKTQDQSSTLNAAISVGTDAGNRTIASHFSSPSNPIATYPADERDSFEGWALGKTITGSQTSSIASIDARKSDEFVTPGNGLTSTLKTQTTADLDIPSFQSQPIILDTATLEGRTIPLASSHPTAVFSHGPETVRGMIIQISELLQKGSADQIEIALRPEELGHLRMTITTNETGASVSVLADRPETLELLRRHAELLARSLADLGFDSVDLGFAQNQDDRRAQGIDYFDRSIVAESETEDSPTAISNGEGSDGLIGLGKLDIRL